MTGRGALVRPAPACAVLVELPGTACPSAAAADAGVVSIVLVGQTQAAR